MKKIISLLTVALLIVSCCVFHTGTVFAAGGDYTYKTLSATTAEITGYSGKGGDITIPSTLDGLTVVSIGEQAFYQNKNLKDSVVTIPDTVKSIGEKAFAGSYIKGVKIPASVEVLGNSAFSYCVYLTELELNASVETISNNCFSNCTRLTKVTVPEGVKHIDVSAFQLCNHLTEVKLPSTLNTIDESAFAQTAIESITLPESTTYIKDQAFFQCESLKSITIPAKVKAIGNYAFAGGFSLEEVILEQGVEKIGIAAFDACPIKSITIPSSVTEIENYSIGFTDDVFAGYTKFDDMVITCYKDSATFTYAKDFEFEVNILEEPTEPTTPEDTTAPTETTESTTADSSDNTAPSYPIPYEYEMGDVNMDKKVNVRDATEIQKHIADLITLSPEASLLAEFDGDTRITVKDATAIQKAVAGIVY